MLIREELEANERRILDPSASFSDASGGRPRKEEPCDIRTCYMRDRDRIVHCKSFRRLKDKTQVFLSPQGDHYRTRMMHTLGHHACSQGGGVMGPCGDRAMNAVLPPPELSPFPPSDPDPERL